jgi:hypothetical protein
VRVKLGVFAFILIGVVSLARPFWGQSADRQIAPFFNLSQHYSFLEYAICSGRLQVSHPLSQPYMASELRSELASLKEEGESIIRNHWIKVLQADLQKYCRPDSLPEDQGFWNLGMNGTYRLAARQNRQWTKYRIEEYGCFSLPYLVLVNRTAMDQAYKDDPQYFGDTEEWIQGRVEDAYVMMKYKALSFFAGRISRNFGIIKEPSLILSDNPYSYDHFGFELTTRRIHFSFYVSRLNDMIAFDSQADDTTRSLSKRYFSVQRGELNLRKNLSLALTQVAIYGGPNRSLEAFYLNPVSLYYPDQRNQHVQMSGLWAGEVYWKPWSNVVIFNQLLIDDVIINNEPGQDDRGRHPDRLGITSKLGFADLILRGGLITFAYTRIGNWTYMSYRTWENYLYRDKGMGYPDNSVEAIRCELSYFGKPPLLGKTGFGFKRLGDQKMTAVFGDTIDKFPIGTVEKKSYVDFTLQYMPNERCYALLTFKNEWIKNDKHIIGMNRSDFSVMLALSARMSKQFGE